MLLSEFQAINAQRARRWHHGDLSQWNFLEWAGAMAGEAGEACNVAKKLRRLDLALPNREAGLSVSDADNLKAKLSQECADTIIYALCLLSALGADAESVIEGVFDKKSIEYGFPERARQESKRNVEEWPCSYGHHAHISRAEAAECASRR